MTYTKVQKTSSWSPHIQNQSSSSQATHSYDPSMPMPGVVVEQQQQMPEYTPTTLEWVNNHPLLRAKPSSVQAKLTIGEPGDKYEQEADTIASKVMSMPSHQPIQREIEPEKEEQVQTKPLATSITPLVQREIESEGDTQTNPNLENQLNGSRGGGSPLSDEVRGFMEPRFGADFSGVRVHTDREAVQMNHQLNAQAFTHGSDIYFGAGRSPGNNALTAHELTHVIQQNSAAVQRQPNQEQSRQVIPILEGITPHSQVLGHLQSLENSPGQTALYRQEIVQFQQSHSPEKIATSQQKVLETSKEVNVQEKDNSQTLRRCGGGKKSSEKGKEESVSKDPKLITDFAAKFPDAAELIRKSPEALKLVKEAQNAGVKFGGYAEDGPAKNAWPYTIDDTVYVPKAHTDKVVAMSDFLFELNNAVRRPQFSETHEKAVKGTITAKEYARRKVELEVEGMLRTGAVWSEVKKTMGGGKELDKYDQDFYLSEYNDFKAGKKTKDDIVNDVLQRKYTSGDNAGKTVEQFYMDQYKELRGEK